MLLQKTVQILEILRLVEYHIKKNMTHKDINTVNYLNVKIWIKNIHVVMMLNIHNWFQISKF